MSTNTIWSPRSPNIPNGQIKISDPPSNTKKNNIQTDWIKLNVNSTNRAIKNLEYRVNNLNVVEFRYPTTSDPNGPKTTANSIQEIANDGPFVASYGYTPTTTLLIQNSLKKELISKADSIGWKSAGASTPAPNPEPTGGSPPPAPTLPSPGQTVTNQLQELTDIPVAGGRGSSGLRYPISMKLEQDKIKFQACQIKRGEPTSAGLGFQFPEAVYEPVDGPICLAIQSSISDQNSVDWGPDSVNAIESALYKASSSFMNEGDIQKNISTFMKDLYEKTSQNQELIKKYLAGQAAGINNVLARTDNVVLNPNLELLFQGPQLRPFSFQFKMSARNEPEARTIKAIIKYFKYHMAVRKTSDGLFLRAPHVFTIRYLKGETENHPGINQITPQGKDVKACALTNCSVDYTPLGSYMTYEDGTMVAYTLSLQFQELTPIYDTDYKDYPNDIGF